MDRTKRPAGSTATGQIRRLLESGTASELTENQLLERFIAQGDEAAFALLVDRHGPMVIGVCRRFLRDPNDVDDAFQATFLILVRKAGSLRDRELLGNWLYGVACKVAHRARSSGIRQRLRFTSTQVDLVDPSGPTGTIPGSSPSLETDMLIHEEISRLPQKYRSPIVLCYLEGLTHDEAASRLGWPVGTVKGRLSRARDLLRPRLARRGLALSTAALSSVLTVPSAEAAVTDMLAFSTIRAALATIGRAGPVAAGGPGISLSVQSLVRGVLNAMFLTKIKLMFVPALVVTAVAAGAATVGASRFGPQFFEAKPRFGGYRPRVPGGPGIADHQEGRRPGRGVCSGRELRGAAGDEKE
ncbi:MAG: RNA polymerase sigma factor [Isosphaeraceae bacterium]